MKFGFCQTFHPTSANIFLRACALVDIHWHPVSLRTSKRGHCDPRRHRRVYLSENMIKDVLGGDQTMLCPTMLGNVASA